MWSETCPAIAASSKIMMRVHSSEFGKMWCILPGFVLMQFMGFPQDVLLVEKENSKLMSSFAGNAFSGRQCECRRARCFFRAALFG
eukprot:2582998-Pyramimonas_sp.AAC.1